MRIVWTFFVYVFVALTRLPFVIGFVVSRVFTVVAFCVLSASYG